MTKRKVYQEYTLPNVLDFDGQLRGFVAFTPTKVLTEGISIMPKVTATATVEPEESDGTVPARFEVELETTDQFGGGWKYLVREEIYQYDADGVLVRKILDRQWLTELPVGAPVTLDVLRGGLGVSGFYPWRLLVYYGEPDNVNGLTDNDAAAALFAGFDFVVLAEELLAESHGSHDNTALIIAKAKAINPDMKFFGYINIAVTDGMTTWDEPIAALQDKMADWKAYGADHIFFDQAGYDFEVPRSRLNTLLDYAHDELGVGVMVNAFVADDVMGSDVDASFNPDGTATKMGETDFYMMESWVVNSIAYTTNQGYNTMAQIQTRADSAVAYRESLGVTVVGLNGIDYNAHSDAQVEEWFGACQAAAAIYSVPFGVNAYEYSAIANNINVVFPHHYDWDFQRWYKPEVDRTFNGTTELSREDIGMVLHVDETDDVYFWRGPQSAFEDGPRSGKRAPVTVGGKLLIPPAGNRWYITDYPFAADLAAVVQTGDRFSYSDGHAQAGETYIWNGSTWVLDTNIVDAPASVLAVIEAEAP